MRLAKYLAACGVASRRKAETLISEGRVQVNGETVLTPATQVDATDDVRFDGRPVAPEKKVYILLNKPRGVVSTSADKHASEKILDLVDVKTRLYSVGRLDKDTSGLLLLTNDGDLTFKLTHPRFHIEKTYVAKVRGHVDKKALTALASGVTIFLDDDGKQPYTTRPAAVNILRESRGATTLSITIAEGKKRQVRKMCAAVGHPVVRLTRTAIGPLKDDTLGPGAWRYLTDAEVAALKSEVSHD